MLGAGIQHIFRSLKYRNYRLFFGGQSISLIGTWIQRIAMPWLVYDLTDSAFLLGLVGFSSQIPTFLFSSFAGVMVDRWDRYRLLIITQILSMFQALILALMYFTGTLEVWHIILLSVMLGCINAFDIPTRQSLIVDMVEEKEDLGNAIALNSTMVNSARLLGPSIAGIIIATAGEGICFLINAFTFLVVIISLLRMKIQLKSRKKKETHVFQEFKEGFQYTFGTVSIKSVILLLALISLIGMPYAVLMPVVVNDIFSGDSHTYGFLMGASGLGALVGAIYLASRKNVLGLNKIIPFSAGVFGLGLVIFSMSRFLPLSILLMVITGAGMMLQMASSNTIIQTVVDDQMRGRVMSFYTMAFMGMAPIGSLLAGAIAEIIGAPVTLGIGGLLCVLGALFFAARFRIIHHSFMEKRDLGISTTRD